MRIFARRCVAKEIGQDEAQDFIEAHHRQRALRRPGRTKNFGLFYEEELVAVLQCGAPRTAGMKRKYSEEILRLAFRQDTRVVGGASKLISYYRKVVKPTDFFTYQDGTGESTDLYDLSGMKRVGKGSRKKYLVAPGKTLATASRNEALGIAYASQYGPDRILGTTLGEVTDKETGKRKTNPQIFLDELGWHVEETEGDTVWEWVDPNLTFYTYKLTASDSQKYYYGVSHVKKAGASLEECLLDGYYGSGGIHSPNNKFVNWKKKHRGKVKKEIIGRYERRMEAYSAELDLIGDRWRTDPLCLNSIEGGRSGGLGYAVSRRSLKKTKCSVHGLTFEVGGKCMKCSSLKARWFDTCETHGKTLHGPQGCLRCFSSEKVRDDVCGVHGKTSFMGNTCKKCSASKMNKKSVCPKHGTTSFQGEKCLKCQAERSISLLVCPVHGETKHRGDTCYKCVRALQVQEEECQVHGLTPHRGGKCQVCLSGSAVSLRDCERHGTTKHRGSTCYRCSREKTEHRTHETKKKDCFHCENEVDTV